MDQSQKIQLIKTLSISIESEFKRHFKKDGIEINSQIQEEIIALRNVAESLYKDWSESQSNANIRNDGDEAALNNSRPGDGRIRPTEHINWNGGNKNFGFGNNGF